jgi:hypothetical protein
MISLYPLNLILYSQDPMVSLDTGSSAEHHAPTRTAQLGHSLQLRSPAFFAVLFATTCALLSAEPTLRFAVPDNECGHYVLVGRGPAIFEIDTWERVMAGLIGIECLVLVK